MNKIEIIEMINKMKIEDRRFIKKEIKGDAKRKKVKDNYKREIALLFDAVDKKNSREILRNAVVSKNTIMSTDLEHTVVIPNVYNIKKGVYNKTSFDAKIFENSLFDIDEFAKIETSRSGEKTVYSRVELLERLEQVVFAASKDKDNKSINCVRFTAEKIVTTDTFRLITQNLKSNFEFSLSLKSAKILIKLLKLSDAEIVEANLKNNNVTFFVEDYILKSRIIELEYPDFKNIINNVSNASTMTLKSENLKELFEKIVKLSKDAEYQHTFKFDFKNEKITVSDIDIEIDADIESSLDTITLRAKFILEYIKANKIENELRFEFASNRSPVKINDHYIVMPFLL